MTDAELNALSALVLAQVCEINAANDDRKHRGEAMAYTGYYSQDITEAIILELKQRNILPDYCEVCGIDHKANEINYSCNGKD